MKHFTFRWLASATVVLGWLAMVARPGLAVEDAQGFLEKLTDRGYFDTALEYLDQMRTSPLCPADFKEKIDYEAAITLMRGSLAVQDPKLREKRLDEARDRFEVFIKAKPDHAMVPGARMQLAKVLLERGRFKMDLSARATKTPEQKTKLQAEARALFIEAKKAFGEAREHFREEHRKFDKVIDPKKTKEIAARERVRMDLLDARMLLAAVGYEAAKTYPRKSKEFKTQMTAAAKQYNELYRDYKRLLAGQYARMGEGRCFKELGNKASLKTAQSVFEGLLLDENDQESYRKMRNMARILLLETLLSPEVKKHADALKIGKEWEADARGSEENSPEGLNVHFLEGEAALALLRAMKKDDKGYRDMLREAGKHFRFVARFRGQYQQQARTKLRDPIFGPTEIEEPTSFADARDRGKAALDEMTAADFEMRLKHSNKKLTAALTAEFEERINVARRESITYFHKALGLAAKQPTTKELTGEVNIVRYYLAYLYWAAGDLHEAAVMGEFLARKYPTSAGGRPGAKIAMAAYVKLRNEIPSDGDRSFETGRMAAIAQYITRQWAGGPEAEEAVVMLVRTALADGDMAQAKKYLQDIPADSPRRAEAEVSVGQSLWSASVRAVFLPEEERPTKAELDTMVKEAKQYLEDGVGRMQAAAEKGGVTYTLLSATLSLAQLYINANEPKKALEKLENPKSGPLTLVAAGDQVANQKNLPVETYKAALRAYVVDQQLDKAQKAMASLEKLMGGDGDAEASKKLTQIYISLGLELEKQVKMLTAANNQPALQKVLNGFQLFLTQISQRKEGNSFGSLHWVAETFYSMGKGLDAGTRTLSPDAKNYYKKACDTYERMLAEVEAGTLELPEGVKNLDSIKIRLARSRRRLREYDAAMKILVGILKTRNMMVDAQIEAAYTYQDRAAEDGEEKYYKKAMIGGTKARRPEDKQLVYLVWGWGKLAKMVSRSRAYRPIFHEAQYNLAFCRFEYAKKRSATERKAMLGRAIKGIEVIRKLYPTMGGEKQFDKYNDLHKKIQKALQLKVTGLDRPKFESKEKK